MFQNNDFDVDAAVPFVSRVGYARQSWPWAVQRSAAEIPLHPAAATTTPPPNQPSRNPSRDTTKAVYPSVPANSVRRTPIWPHTAGASIEKIAKVA